MKIRYNVNTGLYEYCDRLTGEDIFYIFTKIGSEVAKKAASEDAKKSRNTGTYAGMKRLGDEAGKYAGEKLFQKKAPTPKPHGDIIMKELTKDQEKNADF